ncbi:serine hydrolase domain-containing protein [Dyadobacter subterraneus]|uniref:Beta-lactamase family protein n=1 Tax=Dyadobacter subterraneus TaxID=2773304 RepID=A0ABR9WA66_9BACT|nr:serine hydrolase domain-containing protein [Dyadobacter subterraneus]MBE9462288.1 beta-lactamase family protein [Dyadobacter subterraneus]
MKIISHLKKILLVFCLFLCSNLVSAQQYVFFLHNKFIEENDLDAKHPDYGIAEYDQILDYYTKQNFVVISEKRPGKTDVKLYAQKVVNQIDSLLSKGIKPSKITVIGTSKGGYIAQFVSSLAKNKDLNYVFIGGCGEEDIVKIPDINFSGNILSIYEKSDTIGQSCTNMKLKSVNTISRYKEIELNTGLKHGFLFKALPEWLEPSSKWAKQEYGTVPARKNSPVKKSAQSTSLNLAYRIDSLLRAPTKKPFNGIVLISKNGFTRYSKVQGFSDIGKKKPLKFDDQFVIGSISKQFTAVLLLKEYERGRVQLNVPIRNYLPELTQSWVDSVTVDQLLTHMHGISVLDKPLDFKPGTKYAYSQIGYELLARIIEKTSGKSFASLSAALFKKCKMYNTFHPDVKQYQNLVNGYTEQENGKLAVENTTFQNYVAAGSFISTAHDLLLWNKCLHEGKILSLKTYRLMIAKKPEAKRNHPIFGNVEYGYGITHDTKDGILQLGQTGFAPGFISMDFYFPDTKTSVIAFDNVVWDDNDLQKAFLYHTKILEIVRENILNKKK